MDEINLEAINLEAVDADGAILEGAEEVAGDGRMSPSRSRRLPPDSRAAETQFAI